MAERIAFVKTGWSEEYQGGPVVGRHAHIGEYEEAHERFNFLPHRERYYGYLPPIGKTERPPQPKQRADWLVVFVAARDGMGPLTVVGWYEGATFEPDYRERPEYGRGEPFPTDAEGENYIYCLSAPTAFRIPEQMRTITIPGEHFRRTPIVYARGGARPASAWRNQLAKLAERVVARHGRQKERGNNTGRWPDKVHREKVERCAVAHAKEFLRARRYEVTDRQADNCGYDLLAKRESHHPVELHVEVKGTSLEDPRFFITRNEQRYIPHPKWRLLLVTEALTNPKARLMNSSQVEKEFEMIPLAWEVRAR